MISILYSGNQNVFKGLILSLLSVSNNTKEPLDVHILTMELTDVNKDYIALTKEQCDFAEEIIKERNQDSKVTRHDISDLYRDQMLDSPNTVTSYTPYTLLRLFCDVIDLPEKIIYMDTDTMAHKDIKPLFDIDVSEYNYAGTRDYLGKVFIGPNYINAGVLVFNIKNMKENGFMVRARKLICEKKMAFPDQDAINKIEKHKCFFPRCYNEQRKMREDTVIRHFSKSIRWLPFFHTVNVKPWNVEELHQKYKCHDFDTDINQYLSYMDKWAKKQMGANV